MKSNRPVVRSIRGPIILITVGVLFALQNLTNISFDQTWPVLLIVIGLLTLLGRAHSAPPPGPGGGRWNAPNVPPPPNYNWPPPAGGYRGTPYSGSSYAQPDRPEQGGAPDSASSGPAGAPNAPSASNPGDSV